MVGGIGGSEGGPTTLLKLPQYYVICIANDVS